jgi:NitT/TauT family transport system ATP-binding protein
MQQRAALIRTLAIEPTVLLLDEPFSALDYDIKLRAQLNLVRFVTENNPSVLLVTHDIEDAIALADKVIVLSAKPAIVKAEIQIDLGLSRRDPIAARTSPMFQRHFEEIFRHLKYLSPL